MKPALCRLLSLCLPAGLLVACASHPVAGVAVVEKNHHASAQTAEAPHRAPPERHRSRHAERSRRGTAGATAAEATRPDEPQPAETDADQAPLPEQTGIQACDDYLSSYVACHRAAGIYPPDDLQRHYRMMRETLLRSSVDPDVRPQLAQRCNWLATQLREALHGRACNGAPASTGSSPAN